MYSSLSTYPLERLVAPPKPIDVRPLIHSPRILVIEDDPGMLPLVSRGLALVDPDYAIDWVTTADEGRTALVSGEYRAVLADFILADSESGFSLHADCRILQPDARFAMMSALPISLPENAYGLLRKPFDVAECRTFLEGLVAERS